MPMLTEAARSRSFLCAHSHVDLLALALLGMGYALQMHGLTYHSI